MAANRAAVVRTVYAALVNSAPLVALLENADPILGSTATIEELPVPSLVLSLGASEPLQRGDEWDWRIGVDVFAVDVFEAAEVLDAIEDAIDTYRATDAHSLIPLAALRFEGTEEIDAPIVGQGFQRLAAARAVVRARWAA